MIFYFEENRVVVVEFDVMIYYINIGIFNCLDIS